MQASPLAENMRPKTIKDVVGQKHLIGKGRLLSEIVDNNLNVSLVLWGPPGSGKTTIARIIASSNNADFIELSAVSAGKADVNKVVERATLNQNLKQRTILFVDEIHRFNKAQQDAFLPHVENGLITLIGATTENPSFEIITPLLSRSRVIVLEPHRKKDIIMILKRALSHLKASQRVTTEALDYIAELSNGDARVALSNLELSLEISKKVSKETAIKALQKNMPGYDKNGEQHYNVISAFIKSLRGSDDKAALYWLARMLQAGEDPKFIARRMVIFASEDIGLAGNGALSLANATFQAVNTIGMPEAQYNLYHCAVALARSKKSREISEMMYSAKDKADKFPDAKVPLHLRNAPTKLMKDLGYNENYQWKADFVPDKGFLPDEVS